MIENEEILALIPQRPPLVMIDTLLFSDENSTRTSFRIVGDNVFVTDGEFCEAGMMENIAQTAAARAGNAAVLQKKPVSHGYIGSVNKMEVLRLPGINEELITEIIIEDRVFDALIISGSIYCNEIKIASCEMKIFLRAEE
jgi:predicted hotdog family 3-hydroxylacyl-ACP dehydratase